MTAQCLAWLRFIHPRAKVHTVAISMIFQHVRAMGCPLTLLALAAITGSLFLDPQVLTNSQTPADPIITSSFVTSVSAA